MSNWCLKFMLAAQEVNDLTAENKRLQKLIVELKEKLEIKTAVISRWEEEFDHMASQEFCEEIEVISEGGADIAESGEIDWSTMGDAVGTVKEGGVDNGTV